MLINAIVTSKMNEFKLAMTYCDDTQIIGDAL